MWYSIKKNSSMRSWIFPFFGGSGRIYDEITGSTGSGCVYVLTILLILLINKQPVITDKIMIQ